MQVLSVYGLVKSFGRRRVVDGVDFTVGKGEIVGLLGPNGAGKTTTFRMTCGMIDPDRGKVELQGQNVTDWPMFKRARDGGMGYLPQESSVFRKLTVEQNLTAMMELLNFDRATRKARCKELLERFNIAHLRRSRAASLSGGERRRLEIARCLVSDPEIILLDEPFTGIDPVTIANIQDIVRELRDTGISILITDHQVRETLEITDRSYVIRAGQVLCHGTPTQVTSNPEARKYYFGEGLLLNTPLADNDAEEPTAYVPLESQPTLHSPMAESDTEETATMEVDRISDAHPDEVSAPHLHVKPRRSRQVTDL